jgi:hypothetical protein
MTEQAQTIRIGEKHYDATKLTEHAIALLGDIEKIDGELGRLSLQSSIAGVAKSALIEKLVAETANLTEVDAPAEA